MNKLTLKIRAKQLIGFFAPKRRKAEHLINQHEYRVFSQHREDGIIDYLLNSIGQEIGTFVEFGFAPDQCNCLNLAVNRRHSGLFMDGNPAHCSNAIVAFKQLGLKGIEVRNTFINRDNINSLIRDANISGEIDVLSVDVDGNDYWLWQTIDCIEPRIVVIEYNATFGPTKKVSIPYDRDFVRYDAHASGFYHGCSLAAIEHLGKIKGYRLVGVDETGVDAFLVKNELCADIPTLTPEQCFKDNRGRVKYKGIDRKQQFEKIKNMPLVDVSAHSRVTYDR